MRKIVVTGGSGQLATAIRHAAATSHNDYRVLSREVFDICDARSIERNIEDVDIVINCAAYTNVDRAEEEADAAYRINDEAVERLAEACARRNITLIHISTDYVFGGDNKRQTPYSETDTPHPINVYGESKLAGERHVVAIGRGIVIRTSWLYSPWGSNFYTKIVGLMGTHDTLRVVNDQWGTPTSALSLADTLVSIIDSNAIATMQGIYNFSDGGHCTWYDFAVEIARQTSSSCHIEPCSTADYPTKAQRPAYSVLDTRRIYAIEGVSRQAWQQRLTETISLIRNDL